MQGAACAMQKSTGTKGNHEDNVLYVENALQTPTYVIHVDHVTPCLSQRQTHLCMCGYTKVLFLQLLAPDDLFCSHKNRVLLVELVNAQESFLSRLHFHRRSVSHFLCHSCSNTIFVDYLFCRLRFRLRNECWFGPFLPIST